jgi:uncharacterized protein (DUF885 family)
MLRRILLLLLTAVICLAFASTLMAETAFEKACAVLASSKRKDAERLHSLFKLHWDYTMTENPEFATEVGYPGQSQRWTDLSPDAIQRRHRETRAPLRVIQSINRARLSPVDQLNYDLFKRNIEDVIDGTRFKREYLQLTQLDGIQQDVARILELAPRATVGDYEDMIARLSKVPALMEQTIALLKQGLETGVTPPRVTLRDVAQQVQNQLVADPEKNSLLKPFTDFPIGITESQRSDCVPKQRPRSPGMFCPPFAP